MYRLQYDLLNSLPHLILTNYFLLSFTIVGEKDRKIDRERERERERKNEKREKREKEKREKERKRERKKERKERKRERERIPLGKSVYYLLKIKILLFC